ncbi:MAG: hypothetical protein JXA57_03305, partial [Armatimonadetes bacterium]|nr:hypothetical protein [Armatimonadota bacterium]
FGQLIPAMNPAIIPATVAGIGPVIGPRFENKLSLRQVGSTAEDSVIQDFRITAAETKHLGEEYRKAWSGETIRKSQMVPVIRWYRITQPPEKKAFFRCDCRAGGG